MSVSSKYMENRDNNVMHAIYDHKQGSMNFCLIGAMNTNPFASSVQELLAAIQPTLFNLHEQQTSNHQRHRSLSTSSPSPNYMQSCSSDNTNLRVHTPKHSPIRKSHFEKSVSNLYLFAHRKNNKFALFIH